MPLCWIRDLLQYLHLKVGVEAGWSTGMVHISHGMQCLTPEDGSAKYVIVKISNLQTVVT